MTDSAMWIRDVEQWLRALESLCYPADWKTEGGQVTFTVSKLLCLVAVVCFVLAVASVGVGVNLIALGLAFGFSSFLVP